MAGVTDKLSGKAKEIEGKITGDRAREGQGKAEIARGRAKQAGQSVRDKVEGTAREIGGAIRNDDAARLRGRAQRAKGNIEQ